MTARLVVGRVVKPHGIRGEVVVHPETDNPKRFEEGSTMFAGDRPMTVRASRPHQGRLLVFFDGVEDRNAAELLRDVELEIDAADAGELPDGSYYPHELQGCAVVDADGRTLGTLLRVDENPANDLWVVSRDGEEVLVPAVKEIVRDVDLLARRVVLDPPEGLFP
jgi:16S rRNA processing protein RimM